MRSQGQAAHHMSETVQRLYDFIDENYMLIYAASNDTPVVNVSSKEHRQAIAERFVQDLCHKQLNIAPDDITPVEALSIYQHYRTQVEAVVNPFKYDVNIPLGRERWFFDRCETSITRYISHYRDLLEDPVDDVIKPQPATQVMYDKLIGEICLVTNVKASVITTNDGAYLFSTYRHVLMQKEFQKNRRRERADRMAREHEFNVAMMVIRREVEYRIPMRTSVQGLMSMHGDFSRFKHLTDEDRERLYQAYVEEYHRRAQAQAQYQAPSPEEDAEVRQKEFNAAQNFIITGAKYDSKYMRKSYKSLVTWHREELGKFTHLTPEDMNRLYMIYAAEWKRKREQGIIPVVDEPSPLGGGRQSRSPDTVARLLTRLYEVIDRVLLGREPRRVSKSEFRTVIYSNFPDDMSPRSIVQHWDKLFEYYRDRYIKLKEAKARHEQRTKTPIMQDRSKRPVLPFPFRSPKKRHGFLDQNTQFDFNPDKLYLDRIPDRNVKSLKKFMRPNFSPKPYAWEIDHLQYNRGVTYLFAINVNTRYLYVIRVQDKSSASTSAAIQRLIDEEANKGHDVRSIRGDGDKGFNALVTDFARYREIATGVLKNREFYFQDSPYTYHNKTIDAVMRTLRDALGPNTNRFWSGRHDEVIQQLVEYYNNTWHRAIDMTPTEMHRDVELEWAYIRHMTEVLNDVKLEQYRAMYFSYKPGQRLMIHLEQGKTSDKFAKRRRRFEHVGTFIQYRNGNVVAHVDAPIDKTVEIPIFYTKSIGRESSRERDTFGGFRDMDDLN